MQAARNPTSRPCFSDMSHLCCRILGHKAAAVSGSNCVPLISKIFVAQTCGEGGCCMVSVIMHLLFSLREVFRQAKSVMLGKRHFPGYYKNGYVNSVKRGLWLY